MFQKGKETMIKFRQELRSLTLSRIIFLFFIISILISVGLFLLKFLTQTGIFGIGQPTTMRTFTAKEFHFSIQYPDDWSAIETPQGNHGDAEVAAIILPFGRSFPQVLITTRSFPNGTIDQVASWEMVRATKKPGYSSTSLSNSNTSRFGGFIHEYTWTNKTLIGAITIHCQDWYILNGQAGYVLSFCAEDQDWSNLSNLFRDMIKSFDIQKE
jgi:hypothetical protein